MQHQLSIPHGACGRPSTAALRRSLERFRVIRVMDRASQSKHIVPIRTSLSEVRRLRQGGLILSHGTTIPSTATRMRGRIRRMSVVPTTVPRRDDLLSLRAKRGNPVSPCHREGACDRSDPENPKPGSPRVDETSALAMTNFSVSNLQSPILNLQL